MPTDEQQIDAAFDSLMAAGDHPDNLTSTELSLLNIGFSNGWRARGEEVYRLVFALADMVNGNNYPSSSAQMNAYSAAVMLLAEYLPEKEAVDAD